MSFNTYQTQEVWLTFELRLAVGEVHINKVSASYTGTESVLEELSLSFKPGENIAICGRTGRCVFEF
jgi:ABC-type multidrug transport system fused ATPase/permease subunit